MLTCTYRARARVGRDCVIEGAITRMSYVVQEVPEEVHKVRMPWTLDLSNM